MPACSALGCTNRSDRDNKRGVTFHKFPKKEDLKQEWIKAVGRKKFVPSNGSCLCSKHFAEEHMDRTSLCCVRLREGAVPSIFPSFSANCQKSKKGKAVKRPRRCKIEAKAKTNSLPQEETTPLMTLHRPFKEKEIMRLVDEYQHLYKTFQHIKDLARIKIDLLLLSLNVGSDPVVKEEMRKVQELVHTVVNGKKLYNLSIVNVENIDAKAGTKRGDEAKKVDDDDVSKNDSSECNTSQNLCEKEVREATTVEAFYQHVAQLSSTFTEQDIVSVFGRLLKQNLSKLFAGQTSNFQTRKLTFCYNNVSDFPSSTRLSENMLPTNLREAKRLESVESDNKLSLQIQGEIHSDIKAAQVTWSNRANNPIKQDESASGGGENSVYFQSDAKGKREPELQIESINNDDVLYTCNFCTKKYKHKSSLGEHMKCHQHKVHICIVCSKEFKTLKNFRCHQRRHRYKESSKNLHQTLKMADDYEQSHRDGIEIKGDFKTGQKILHDEIDESVDLEDPVNVKDDDGDDKSGFSHGDGHAAVGISCNLKEKNKKRPEIQPNLTEKDNQPNICKFCGKTYKHKSSLVEHLKYHDNKVYTCTICSKEFKTKKVLTDHQRYHKKHGLSKHFNLKIKRESGKFESTLCSICGFESKNRNSLLRHLRDHEEFNKNGPQKCSLCEKEFKVKMSLMRHMARHTAAEGSFMCDICGKTFRMQNSMKCHRRRHIESPEACPICGKKISKHNLKRHIKGHSGDKPYECSICHKGFSRRSGRNIHQRRHTRIYPHRCSYCSKGFISPSKLLIHERIHSGERPFSCTVCRKFFISEALAQAHIARHGPDAVVKIGNTSASYRCDICGKQFNSKFSQMRHHHNHSAVKPYKCMVCGTGFSTKFGLKSHSWTHSKEKRFQCGKCEKGFNDKRHYVSHVKKSHPEDVIPVGKGAEQKISHSMLENH